MISLKKWTINKIVMANPNKAAVVHPDWPRVGFLFCKHNNYSKKDPLRIAGAWVYCIAIYTLAIRINPNKHLGQTLT